MSVHASPWMLKALRIASRNGQWHTTCSGSSSLQMHYLYLNLFGLAKLVSSGCFSLQS